MVLSSTPLKISWILCKQDGVLTDILSNMTSLDYWMAVSWSVSFGTVLVSLMSFALAENKTMLCANCKHIFGLFCFQILGFFPTMKNLLLIWLQSFHRHDWAVWIPCCASIFHYIFGKNSLRVDSMYDLIWYSFHFAPML